MVEAGRTKTAWFLAEVIFALLALVALAVGIHAFGGGAPGVTVQITAQINPDDVFACEHRPGAVEGDRCSHTAEVVRLWVSEHAGQEAAAY